MRGWAGVALALLLWLTWAAGGALSQTGPEKRPVDVRLGFVVTSLSGIDPADSSFRFSSYVWLIDPAGLESSADDLQILTRQASVAEVQRSTLSTGAQFTAFTLQATVDQTFDLRDFPFDRQTLRLNIETAIPASRLRLVPDAQDSRLADVLTTSGWTVTAMRFEERLVDYKVQLDPSRESRFSRVTLLIDIERIRSPLVIDRFVGYAMAFLITALIFFVPSDQIGVRIGMSTSAVFAAVGNRYGLDAAMGGNIPFGLVEQLTLIVFLTIFTAIATTLITFRLDRGMTQLIARRTNHAIGAVVISLSLGLAVYAVQQARG